MTNLSLRLSRDNIRQSTDGGERMKKTALEDLKIYSKLHLTKKLVDRIIINI